MITRRRLLCAGFALWPFARQQRQAAAIEPAFDIEDVDMLAIRRHSFVKAQTKQTRALEGRLSEVRWLIEILLWREGDPDSWIAKAIRDGRLSHDQADSLYYADTPTLAILQEVRHVSTEHMKPRAIS